MILIVQFSAQKHTAMSQNNVKEVRCELLGINHYSEIKHSRPDVMASSTEGQPEKRNTFIKVNKFSFNQCMLVFENVQTDKQLH